MRTSLYLKIVALLMAALAVFMTASCSLPGVDEETTTESEAVTLEARPVSKAEILKYYNRVVNAIKEQKPGVSKSFEASVRDVDTGNNKEAAAMIQFAKIFSESLEEVKNTSEYGNDLDAFMPITGTPKVSRLSVSNIVSATIADVEDDLYSYDIHIVLKDGNAAGPVVKAFDMDTETENALKKKVLNTFQNYRSLVEVSDYDVSYNGCEIFARVNKETNRVTSLHLVMNSVVTTNVLFTGTLAQLGETDVKFRLQSDLEFYDFIWDEPTEPAAEE